MHALRQPQPQRAARILDIDHRALRRRCSAGGPTCYPPCMLEGAQIGQYRILEKIGEGGMGAVFLAVHTMIGRRAAIKVLLPALSAQPELVDRFFNEARATTAIPDPGIVQVFDFGFHTDNAAYIVMELLEGESLDARIRRLGALPVSEALRIARQCAGSLAAAHTRGIVHRDLKPDNLFMVRDPEAVGGERPKILDFGIAKLSGEQPGRMQTRTGALMGTPMYMSPEQCRGIGTIDHRADIYALGCVVYQLLTGRPPFDMEGMGDVIAAHLREAPRAPSQRVLGMPHGVDDLVLRCLAKAPEERFQTMTELQAACDALLARISNVGGGAPASELATPLAPRFRSVVPQATSEPQPGAASPTERTTLSTASGQPLAGAPRRRIGLWIGLALGLSAGGAAILIVLSSRGDKPAAPAATPMPAGSPPPTAAATAPLDAPAATAPPDAAPTTAPPDAAPPADAPPDATPPADAPRPRPHSHLTKPAKDGDLYDTR